MIDTSLDLATCTSKEGFIDGTKFGAKLVLELLVN